MGATPVPRLKRVPVLRQSRPAAWPDGKRLLISRRLFPRGLALRQACYPSAMFDIGLQEMLVIGVLALLVFGPSKLPELGRMIGRAMREFRRASDEFRNTVETNLHINDPDPPPPDPTATAIAPAETPLPSELEPVSPETTTSVVSEPAPEHGEPFVAQRGSRLFHRRECTWVSRIAELDRVYLKRVPEALEQGYLQCPACDPWEPR